MKYASEFYSYKELVPLTKAPVGPPTPDTALEQQIQKHVMLGNKASVEGRHALALESYLLAWGLLPKLVLPLFPPGAVFVDDRVLLELDLTDQLVAASVELHRFRGAAGPSAVLGAAADPPDALVEIGHKFGMAKLPPANRHLERGIVFAAAGRPDEATRELELARKLAGDDPELLVDVEAALASAAVIQGRLDEAHERYLATAREFKRLHRTDKAGAMLHNAGVAQTLRGQPEEAAKTFAEGASTAPGGVGWTVTHSVNPGIESFQRPVGTEGLPLLLSAHDGGWAKVPTAHAPALAESVSVLHAGGAVELDLGGDAASAIRADLLDARVGATTLAELKAHLWLLPQFVTYLAHVGGYVLPMALGDTYAELGDYESAAAYYLKARDYAFLNAAIERPVVWTRLAKTFLKLGNRLYRDRDTAGARAQYEQIVKIVDGGFELSGPLYSGGFAPLAAETLDFLNSDDRLGFTGIDYGRRLVLLQALANLTQILNGINYLGFPEEIVPIHSWRYLQNVARYLANQAIQIERSYINFKDAAERDEATRLALEQSVDAAAAATAVEQQRVEAARDQAEVSVLSAEAARTRLENSVERKADYETTSAKLATLEEITAWATGPMDRAVVDGAWAGALGIPPGEYDTYQVTRYAARARSKISRGYELRNMDRQIDEMEDAKAVADAQVVAAESMVDVAEAQRELAQLREEQAQEQLNGFNAQEFTPELWSNLAEAQRELSQRYLDWAIGAAFLMERAFEFEYDLDVNRVRFDYARSDLHGLLAGDFLLADIDQFGVDRLLDTQKALPAKVVISLADRFPFQFFHEFQRSGRLEFDTLLEDFERMHPGTHIRKLRRVEVVVEGLIGRGGVQGFLSNSGFSFDRDRDGAVRLRVQKPETMLLSLYDMRRDGFVLTPEEGVLEVFENSGVASTWTLEVAPESNDVDLRAISNIHLVLYYDAYHSARVASIARAELEAGAVYEHSLALALQLQFPDEFFALQDSGEVVFAVDDTYAPVHHQDPRILEARLVIETEQPVPSAGLVVDVLSAAGGLELRDTTDADGMIATGSGAGTLDALRGGSLIDTWTVRLDEAANAAAIAADFTWERVSGIYLFVEYRYTPRGRPLVADGFETDSLANFEIVDDPGATTGGPSAWAHTAAPEGAMTQTSGISGGVGGADQGPERPGTYLMRSLSEAWPALDDVAVSCRLRAGDPHAIGIVFRYQDVDNFYFLQLDRERGYRRLGKKVAGIFSELNEPAFQPVAAAFELDETLEVRIAAVGDALVAFIDGQPALAGRDASLAAPGRVGLYACGNPAASFLDLAVRPA